MICMINRGLIEPHPDNPRKDLGDLTELAASIAKQGILQNLTVVPHPEKEDKYRIIIGHRRFAASGMLKMDKFDELPCVVDMDMTYPEQIAVMMSENIQRNDLTIAEKVGGVQMMMDLGMTALDVARNTGISTSTAYKYAKIAGKVDKEKIKAAERRGATLFQFEEIAAIEDEQLRAGALEAVGTNNYQHALWKWKNAKMRGIWKPIMLIGLQEIGATEIQQNNWQEHAYQLDMYYTREHDAEKITGLSRKKQYVYIVYDDKITVYELKKTAYNDEKARREREKREQEKKRVETERAAVCRFKDMQKSFMQMRFKVQGREDAARRLVLWMLTRTEYTRSAPRNGCFDMLLNAKKQDCMGCLIVSNEQIRDIPENKLLLSMVFAAMDRARSVTWAFLESYSGKLKRAEDTGVVFVRELYEHLEALGYPVSDEEREWLDGTHECYQ